MSKKHRFRTTLPIQHAKGFQTLLASARQPFYNIFWSLWVKWNWITFLLVISEILGWFINTLTADDKPSSFRNTENLWQPNQTQLYKEQKIFTNFLLHFRNLSEVFKILKQEMTLTPLGTPFHSLLKSVPKHFYHIFSLLWEK